MENEFVKVYVPVVSGGRKVVTLESVRDLGRGEFPACVWTSRARSADLGAVGDLKERLLKIAHMLNTGEAEWRTN